MYTMKDTQMSVYAWFEGLHDRPAKLYFSSQLRRFNGRSIYGFLIRDALLGVPPDQSARLAIFPPRQGDQIDPEGMMVMIIGYDTRFSDETGCTGALLMRLHPEYHDSLQTLRLVRR
jgi:hypothetical protein